MWRSVPTPTAWLLLGTGVAALIGAFAADWIELAVFGVAALVALLLAVPFILGSSSVDLVRTIAETRVTVGDQSVAELRATNPTSRPTPGMLVEERLDGDITPIDIPVLRPGQSTEFLYQLPTGRRGVYSIGPTTASKGDPLGLLRRAVGETPIETLWVHPRTMPTAALPAGLAKDLEGPTFDTSPAGDIAFHAIREYMPGDDIRHVHWMSTARKGTLMVRHYVDNRRPQVGIVIDRRLGLDAPDLFERAVEAAASVGASERSRGMKVAIRAGGQAIVDPAGRSVDELLDALALLDSADVAPSSDVTRITRDAPGTSVIVILTGSGQHDDLLETVQAARRSASVVVGNFHEGEDLIALPRAKVINATSLDAFVGEWNRLR